MPLDFTRLTAKQLRELPGAQTVFFFPVGPLEDHGPHLPLALDVSEADQLCRLAAERLEREKPGWIGVIMPAVPLGVSSNTSSLAITVRGYVLRDWLIDACRSLLRHGFLHFVCFTGQLGPRQLTTIEEAGKAVMRRGPFTRLRGLLAPSTRRVPTFASASSALVRVGESARAPLWSDPLEHGSKRDTSVALALGWLGGEPITAAAATSLGLVPRARRGSQIARGIALFTRKREGFWGAASPVESTARQGDAILAACMDTVFPKLRAAWEGASPNQLFRSWYSVIPLNKSTFKAWLLGSMVVGVMLAWIYLSLAPFVR